MKKRYKKAIMLLLVNKLRLAPLKLAQEVFLDFDQELAYKIIDGYIYYTSINLKDLAQDETFWYLLPKSSLIEAEKVIFKRKWCFYVPSRLDEFEIDSFFNIPEVEPKKQAVCAIVKDGLGLLLSVSRKDNLADFGLPGGKVDANETLEKALVREVLEETGYTVQITKKLFTDNDGEFEVTTFEAEIDETAGRKDVAEDETGTIAWLTPRRLSRGSFGDYNQKLFSHLGLFY